MLIAAGTLLEGKYRPDVGTGGDVASTVLVGADTHVTDHLVIPHIRLQGLDLQQLGAPADPWRRKETAFHREPVVEAAVGAQADDLLAEVGLQALQVLVRLWKLLVGIAEEVLHPGDSVPQKDRERGAVLAAREP